MTCATGMFCSLVVGGVERRPEDAPANGLRAADEHHAPPADQLLVPPSDDGEVAVFDDAYCDRVVDPVADPLERPADEVRDGAGESPLARMPLGCPDLNTLEDLGRQSGLDRLHHAERRLVEAVPPPLTACVVRRQEGRPRLELEAVPFGVVLRRLGCGGRLSRRRYVVVREAEADGPLDTDLLRRVVHASLEDPLGIEAEVLDMGPLNHQGTHSAPSQG